jgi:hypothetical protein
MAACLTDLELVLTTWNLTRPDVMLVVDMEALFAHPFETRVGRHRVFQSICIRIV